jgi:hypothetical protein
MIPKTHLKEINRLSRLTGTETSIHAPIIDPSGFTQQGWDKTNQQAAEKQFSEIVERSHELNPEGNVPVTIHASAVPGTEYVEWKNPETGKIEEVPSRMIAVNQETGDFIPLVREKRFYPTKPEGRIYEAKEELDMANNTYWDNRLSQLVFYKERGDELLRKFYPLIAVKEKAALTGRQEAERKAAEKYVENAGVYFRNAYQSINTLFNQAYKFADKKGKEELAKAAQSEEFKRNFNIYKKTGDPAFFSQAIQNLVDSIQKVTSKYTPQIYRPIEDFTKDKSTETLSNVALNAYKKFGDRAPIISVENPPYGTALSRAKDLKAVVEITRKKFRDKLMKEKGISRGEAARIAEKLIGVTWDTSHISMMRKSGFKPEKLVEEAKIIAPFVKHVHLNDNFGSTHTDLPPGMATVPIKDIMKELEKAGFKGKKILEGAQFFQQFQTSPHPYVLEALGSPLYGAMMQPYWNQIRATYGNYFAFPLGYFPEQHFSIYGGGFSALPTELGGQVPGKESRLAGTPME